MAEAEIVDLSLSQSEWNYVKLRPENVMNSLSRRNGLLGAAVLVCLYLLSGQLAGPVCSLLTSVPAAIFSYKVLSQPEAANPRGYRSILFYWLLQGGFGLLDVALRESYGYFLIKFVLMSLAFSHAASQNKHVFAQVAREENESTLQEDLTQCLTSIISCYDADGYAIQPFSLPSTAKGVEEEERTQQLNCPRHSHRINRALTPHPDSVSPAQLSRHTTVGLSFSALITNPMELLVFTRPQETKLVDVTNISQQNVMWALKCNALHRVAAFPACGVIARGARQQIRVTYLAEDGGEHDKLAIDYALVQHGHYDPTFVHRADSKKRHLLRINYTAKQ